MINHEEEFEFIEEPFLTEDGILNEACLKELEHKIINLPPTYERLIHDSEWTTPSITHYREITGAFAYWAVRQIGSSDEGWAKPSFPPNLEKLVGYLDSCLKLEFKEKSWVNLSLCEINKICHKILLDSNLFLEWNDKKVIGENWLDLEALIHNITLTIRDERRKNREFDRKFEEQWSLRNAKNCIQSDDKES